MSTAALLAIVVAAAPSVPTPEVTWRRVAEGVEYAEFPLVPKPLVVDGLLRMVRVDPVKARVRAFAASQVGGGSRTARRWCDELELVAAINAGMYAPDHSTHTGYFRVGEHLNSSRWLKHYRSILLLDPRQPDPPRAAIEDADTGEGSGAFASHRTVIRNLRLIRGNASNA